MEISRQKQGELIKINKRNTTMTDEKLQEMLAATPKHDTTTEEGKAAALAQLLKAPEGSKAWHLGMAIGKIMTFDETALSNVYNLAYAIESHLWEYCNGILISTPAGPGPEENQTESQN